MGAHTLRGRVDRVDRLADGGYELIDYKTGRPRSAAALREDVQLSLYAVGAREAWQLDATQQAYLYVLDDEKVRVPSSEIDAGWIADTVDEVARRHPRPGLRADALLYGLLDVRLPDRLPGGGAMTGIRRAMPVVFTDDPAGQPRLLRGLPRLRRGRWSSRAFSCCSRRRVPTTQVLLAWADPDVMDPQVHRLDMSIEVADSGAAHADAVARGLDIVYPLTDEPWGVRRFFVREPSGKVVNVASHIADLGGRPTRPSACARAARAEARRRSRSPGRTSPPASTTPMIPDFMTTLPSSSRSSVAFIRPGWMPSSCAHGLRSPVTSTIAASPRCSFVADREAEQVDAGRRDVLAHLTGLQPREALLGELVVQLGVDEVHLAQVGLRRVAAHVRAVLDGRAAVRVALDAEAREQADGVGVGLGHRVPGAHADRGDDAVAAGGGRLAHRGAAQRSGGPCWRRKR